MMAMLAEPKRRQKLSTDPRNKTWSNDGCKFGEQLMKKMGWQQGKGLGINEDGKTSHITVAVKNNTLGLGCSQKHEDNWISHQDDFNDLLSSLSQDHDAPDSRENPSKPQNLHEKSKKAKHRVHYKKFTQGKDLSTRSSREMNCIMGVRSNCSTPNAQSETNSDGADSPDDCEGRVGLGFASTSLQQPEGSHENSFGVQTTTNSNSIQEYFTRKMEELRQKRKGEAVSHSNTVSSSNSQQENEYTKTVESTSVLDNSVDYDWDACHQTAKKKKKKKSKEKRKKLKYEELNEMLGRQDDCSQLSGTVDGEESSNLNNVNNTKKKKKKRTHKPVQDMEDSEDNGGCNALDFDISGRNQRKKSKTSL